VLQVVHAVCSLVDALISLACVISSDIVADVLGEAGCGVGL